jgi:hypothetical protein
VNPTGYHGDSGLPETGERGTGALSKANSEFTEDDLGLAVFPSEKPPAEGAPLPADPPVLAAPEPPDAADSEAKAVAAPDALPDEVAAAPPDTDSHLGSEVAPTGRLKTPALSIADLIDNHVRLEWQEAVAIALHLCGLMSKEPGANVHRSLVEPWNVEITNAGEVHVLPGGSSSDPLVKQVGRVLRALLQDSIAPLELRLVASQASFDVPVYSSVDELSAALRRFDRIGSSDAIRAAFNRGLEAKLATHVPQKPAVPSVRPMPAPVHAPVKRTPLKASPLPGPGEEASWSARYLVGGVGAVVAVAVAAFVMSRVADVSEVWSSGSKPVSQALAVLTPPRTSPPPEKRGTETAERPAAPTRSTHEVLPGRSVPPGFHRPSSARGVPESESPPAAPTPRPPASVQRPASGADSLEAAERRAGALLAEGRAGEATVIFDSIVMKNPLYQLDPERSTPEALAAFQSSKRLILPAMARRYYQEALTAYDAGDFSLTLMKGERALALLRDVDSDPSDAGLNGDVTDLMALAASARTLEESRIYTKADRDVTPPRPIGRQLSAASLSGRSPLTGRLELVVGRTGEVETVKLDTPFNGYHDRMIVSAAKAWHYRPALKKGQPVRYSMVMSITLPDF